MREGRASVRTCAVTGHDLEPLMNQEVRSTRLPRSRPRCVPRTPPESATSSGDPARSHRNSPRGGVWMSCSWWTRQLVLVVVWGFLGNSSILCAQEPVERSLAPQSVDPVDPPTTAPSTQQSTHHWVLSGPFYRSAF